MTQGFTCHACGAYYDAWPKGPCPACKGNNTLRPGKVDQVTAPLLRRGVHPLGGNLVALARHGTGIPELDLLLGGASHPGVVDGHVVILIGQPGAGKTTLGLQLMAAAARPLFISAEQPEEEIAARAQEVSLDVGKVMFSCETELGSIEKAIADTRASDCVIDSLACIWDRKKASPPGSAWAVKEAARRLFEIAHATKTTLWVIGHMNKKGGASGPMAAIHWCDVLLQYDVGEDELGTRTLYFPQPKKNRGGPATGRVCFGMSEAMGLTALPAYAPRAEELGERA